MGKTWQIRISTFFLLSLLIFVMLAPVFPDAILLFAVIPIYVILKRADHIKKFDMLDLLLIGVYFITILILIILLEVHILATIPWWKIIIVGIAADVIANILGTIPIIGDWTSALINALIGAMVIGGVEGMFAGLILMVISLIPGPSIAMNTIMMIIFKLSAELITATI